MNILVTGATGFIGRHLVAKLLQQNEHSIFCLVRNPLKAKFFQQKGALLIHGDITDKSSLEKILRHQIDIVYHCAACVDSRNPAFLNKTNVEGTENVCNLASALSVKCMVYLSSVAVVSGHDCVPLTEDLPYSATNAYGKSKILAEKKVLYYRNKGLPAVILRPPMVYGEDEPHLMRFLLFLLKHRLLPLLDSGIHKLHLVYVENVVAAMLYCLGKKEFLEGTFFVADREVLEVREIFAAFAKGLEAGTAFSSPAWFKNIMLSLPWVGKKMRFFVKDKVYSTERIQALGFRQPYPAYESLVRSARQLYYGKHK